MFKLFKDNRTAARNLGNVYLEKVKTVGSSKELTDLLSKTLIYEQNRRINILDISCHDWIREALKEQRRVTQVVNECNGQNSKNNETIDEQIDEDSKTYTAVEDEFGLKDNKCAKFIAEDDNLIEWLLSQSYYFETLYLHFKSKTIEWIFLKTDLIYYFLLNFI